MEITCRFAEFARDTRYETLPPAVVTAARRAILDTLASAIAGSVEPAARIALEVERGFGGNPQAAVLGSDVRLSAAQAALVNGVAAHALDYDDVNYSLRGHPSAPILPAVLALGEHTGASGADVLAGFVVGFELECKLGRTQGPSHYARGWHATSTHGSVGAAAACASLLRLPVEETAMALGIAGSMAAGSRQNFGTMTKPLHPGRAAEAGLTAALLAGHGFTADPRMLEEPLGFIRLFSAAEDHDQSKALAELGEPFDIISPGISVKKYPCCYNTHRALDAILALRDEHQLSPDAVASVEVRLPESSAQPLIHPRPTSGLEGKFSMQYCMAAALLDGSPRLTAFEDASVQRPAAQDLLRRIEMVTESGQVNMAEGPSEVTVRLRDGTALQRRVEEPRGSGGDPLSWDELVEKFRDCAAVALPRRAADEALAAIERFETLPDVRGLMSLLTAGERVTA
jgi:2-methylcitrate dehydratase PrpD